MIAYASMVKALDPSANILGFDEWGWTNYFISGADAAAQNWGATYNGLDAEAWLLNQLHQHDTATGTRLLDYFTLHYYPQSGRVQQRRLHSPWSSAEPIDAQPVGPELRRSKAGSAAPASMAARCNLITG